MHRISIQIGRKYDVGAFVKRHHIRSIMKIREKTNTILGHIALIIMIITAYFLCKNAFETMENVFASTEIYYMVMLVFFLNVLFAIKSRYYFIIHVALLLTFFAWLSFADISYSPIDECMNFENINHIIDNHELYTFNDEINYTYLNEANEGFNSVTNGTNYEAVQAPLYYILLVVIGGGISNAYVRLHFFRMISLLCVLVVFCFVHKAVRLLELKEIIKGDGQIYRMSLLLTIFNPGYLYRASRLNNETLVCVLMAMLVYYAIKSIVYGYSPKSYWILSFISSALFLTKYTAIYAYVVFGIIALYQRKIKEAILPICVGGFLTVPWFAFNMATYGSLTAMEQHLEFVFPIVNPRKLNVDIFDGFFGTLPITFFSSEEVAFPSGEALWLGCFFIAVMFVVLNEVVAKIVKLKNNKWRVNEFDIEELVNIICVALIISAMLCLIAGSISTKMHSIRGRYIYGPSIVFVFLFLFYYDKILKNIRPYFLLAGVLIIAIAETRCVTSFTDRVFRNEKVYASAMYELELHDLTDSNWNHGVGRFGPSLLADNDGSNYNVLIGRYLEISDQGALIQSIQEDGDYVWITLNKSIDADTVNSNIVKLENMYEENSVNTTVTDNEGNIEQQEVCQKIMTNSNGKIAGFEVMLGTYCDADYDALVHYKVLTDTDTVLMEGEQALENIADNAYTSIYFDRPISVHKNEKLSICFSIDNEADKQIALYTSKNDMYQDGELYINGCELAGKDAVLKIWASWED